MANIKLLMCSSAGRPSSGLYLGNHFSRWSGRGFGFAINKTPGFIQGWVVIIGLEVCEDTEVDLEVGGTDVELTTGIVLLVIVLIVWVEEMKE